MKALHDRLTGRRYSFSNEGIPGLNIEWETRFGFPWGTRDSQMVGESLIAFGNLIMKAALSAGASYVINGYHFDKLLRTA
jgi:hypothetical protein